MKRLHLFLLALLTINGIHRVEGQTTLPAAPAETAATTNKDYELIGVGTLRFSMPKTWQDAFTRGMQMGVPVDELDLHEADTNVFRILVSAIHKADQQPGAGERMKADLAKIAQLELPGAGEKALDIHDFKGDEATGCYFMLTDMTPKPGEYKYLTQGFAQLNGVILTFRVVSNRQNGIERPQALAMIKSARVLPKK